MRIEDSINDKNEELFKTLIQTGIKIDFEIDKTANTWSVQRQVSYKIASNNDSPNPSALAHELLHIKLLLEGFWDSLSIYKYFNERNSLFNHDEIGILNNTLAHFKMIDDFLGMGFHIEEFLSDTPKKYYIDGIVFQITHMKILHGAGVAKAGEQAMEIVQLVGNLKLFELYKQKDPGTMEAFHVPTLLEQIKEINKELVEGLSGLFEGWIEASTVDNMQFYFRLNDFLKKQGFLNAIAS